MPTIKQKRAIQETVKNGGNVSRAMRDVGYSLATVNNPSNLTKSKGYKELLKEYGLSEDLVVKALVADIKTKKGKRLGELSLGAEILGMRKMGPIIANQINLKEVEKHSDSENPEYRRQMEEFAKIYEKYLLAKMDNVTSITIKIPSTKIN